MWRDKKGPRKKPKTDDHHVHKPVQHRDGKPPWCNTCGLTKGYQMPVSRFNR